MRVVSLQWGYKSNICSHAKAEAIKPKVKCYTLALCAVILNNTDGLICVRG